MQRPLTLILIFLCASTAVMAQPELRMEQTNLPPVVGSLMRAGGKLFHESYMGLHAYDPSTQTWRYLGEETKPFADAFEVVHPNGLVIVNTLTGTVEFDAVTETVTRHDGSWYQVRHSDSLVANIEVVNGGNVTTMRLVWLRWPALDTARVDELYNVSTWGYHDLIPCADGSILAMTTTAVCRFHYDRPPSDVYLSQDIMPQKPYVYSDAERTHIVLTGSSQLIYSTDLFKTYSYLSAVPTSNVKQVRLTSDPDAIYLAHDGIVLRSNRRESDRDTIRRNMTKAFSNFEVMGDTVVLGIPDSILVITNTMADVANTGLPSRSFTQIMPVPGGIIASGALELAVHASGGEWDVLSLDLLRSQYDHISVHIPMGGNSVDDFWFVSRDMAIHVNPRPTIEKIDYCFPGYASRGLYTTSGVSYFTMLFAIEESCGSNQVVWVNGNSPVRTLLCKDNLRNLIVFNNRDHVAFTRDGIGWRTIDGDLDRWEQISVPRFPASQILRMSVKGDHGLAQLPYFIMWTHDAGRTWQSNGKDQIYFAALAADGSIYTLREREEPEPGLIIERRTDSTVVEIATYGESVYDMMNNTLTGLAFDDAEQRLYITTLDWTASLSVSVSSVHERREDTISAPLLPDGLYDLFGRYVAQDEHMITTSGLYLSVDASGIRKVMIVR